MKIYFTKKLKKRNNFKDKIQAKVTLEIKVNLNNIHSSSVNKKRQ